jgi:hypothetical protein
MKTDFSLEDIPAKVVKGDAISIAAGSGFLIFSCDLLRTIIAWGTP